MGGGLCFEPTMFFSCTYRVLGKVSSGPYSPTSFFFSPPLSLHPPHAARLPSPGPSQGPNQGRQFYACPQPQGEQCDHFEWADEPQQSPGFSASSQAQRGRGGGRVSRGSGGGVNSSSGDWGGLSSGSRGGGGGGLFGSSPRRGLGR